MRHPFEVLRGTLEKETMELLTLIFRANSRKDKAAVLEEARILSGLAIP